MLLSCAGNCAPATGAAAAAAFVLPRMFGFSNVKVASARRPFGALRSPDDRAERRAVCGWPGYWLRAATVLLTE